MTRRPKRELSEEDRILWNRVAVTTTPLKGRRHATADLAPDAKNGIPEEKRQGQAKQASAKEKAGASQPRLPRVPSAPRPATSRELDRPTRTKLARERLSIDASVDLHGMTQAQAHTLLLRFLTQAHATGLRHVLVITGKGGSPGSEGVLRRAVPEWLATAPFRPLVSGHGSAARHHGGGGALYIRLRRARP